MRVNIGARQNSLFVLGQFGEGLISRIYLRKNESLGCEAKLKVLSQALKLVHSNISMIHVYNILR
ncbi:MAG: hypothetical protein RBS16_09680 [Candidatus Cloacimonadales bacterium]|jgi:hypothetical protein|nr:hypothetical protein [Candidatus Cloacimonadales bacterium]HPY97200.1 hypothetical protein [Candidatus Cloacimonadota bacterium]HQB41728.1 hypothetical protein [Candidatus Cloacimonadota bacterium]